MPIAIAGFDPDDVALLQALPPEIAALAVSAQPEGRARFDAVRAGATLSWTPPDGRGSEELLPALSPSRPAAARLWQLDAVRTVVAAALPPPADRIAAAALTAGLLQVNDWLDESHQASQAIEGAGPTRSGDYWHAIMHRREPDYGNAKYWFRSVGRHPAMSELPRRAEQVLQASAAGEHERWLPRLIRDGRWEPFAFVDLCEAVAGDESSPLGRAARRIQRTEMLLLLAHCSSETLPRR